jgi:hypothetical protein
MISTKSVHNDFPVKQYGDDKGIQAGDGGASVGVYTRRNAAENDKGG